MLQIKGNQKSLHTEIEVYYHKLRRENFVDIIHDKYEDIDKGHDRIEQQVTHQVERSKWVSSAQRWYNAKSFIRTKRKTITAKGERSEIS